MLGRRLKTILIGRPLPTEQAEHEKLNVPLGLAVFAADALSSTAYATDEVLIALAGAQGAGQMSLPVAMAIVALIALVVISYRQVINAYPNGGGAYVVARRNLGIFPSHIAAASLMIDYMLTVAVSISAGIEAITSTKWISVEHTVFYCISCAVIIMVLNLRGVKESGRAFAVPAYTFILAMLSLVCYGIFKIHVLHDPAATGYQQAVAHPAGFNWGDMAYMLLFLKAFSHGCAGLTGIEAVSNGVQSFEQPASGRANTTMTIMGILLSSIFLGITYIAFGYNIAPVADETILSQVATAVFGHNTFMYFLVQITTMILLILAANTAFAGFPGVANLLADDGYLPRQLKNIGDRLVFNNGILILGFISMSLIWLYQGNTHSLIPLYSVGVFISFTLSQSGMVIHHLREREKGWRPALLVNAFGACVTALVTVILAIEKFTEGAWIVMVAVPALIYFFRTVKRHYMSIGKQLALDVDFHFPVPQKHKVLVLVSALGKGTVPALEYARAMSPEAEAVHVELNPEAAKRLRTNWEKWGAGIPLVILPSPFRSISEPLLEYLDEIDREYGGDAWVTIVIPEFVTKEFWHNFLHNQSALMLSTLLRFRKGKIVTTVRFFLDE